MAWIDEFNSLSESVLTATSEFVHATNALVGIYERVYASLKPDLYSSCRHDLLIYVEWIICKCGYNEVTEHIDIAVGKTLREDFECNPELYSDMLWKMDYVRKRLEAMKTGSNKMNVIVDTGLNRLYACLNKRLTTPDVQELSDVLHLLVNRPGVEHLDKISELIVQCDARRLRMQSIAIQ